MADNQPFQAVANAYRAKMFRAINAIAYHEKIILKLSSMYPLEKVDGRILSHNEQITIFKKIEVYNRKKAQYFGGIVTLNTNFSKFMCMIESGDETCN